MKRIVIVDAKRTPFGRFRGALAHYSPVELATAAANAALAHVDRGLIDQVILGNVLAAGHGMNIARQVAVALELPLTTPAWTINMMCGSGMQAVLAAVSAIRAGEAHAILAGGTECMSQAKLLVDRPGKGDAPNFDSAVDSLQRDGLLDSFSGEAMGQQAEELAREFQISRMSQDAMAERSQQLYAIAHRAGVFEDELAPLAHLRVDQHPRIENTRASLADLKPVFAEDGSVTAGNASGVNDGAAVVLLAEREFAKAHQWPILAEWVEGVVIGCEPSRMGLAPVDAIAELLLRTKHSWSAIDTLEINEAFAAQTLACLQRLEFQLDLSLVDARVTSPGGHLIDFNSDGGAIAIGHPLAASGARLLAHLAWKIARGRSRTAIGALCIGGGMGIASLLTVAD
jgi:acetyl-CoA C-acetyltransferase